MNDCEVSHRAMIISSVEFVIYLRIKYEKHEKIRYMLLKCVVT